MLQPVGLPTGWALWVRVGMMILAFCGIVSMKMNMKPGSVSQAGIFSLLAPPPAEAPHPVNDR